MDGGEYGEILAFVRANPLCGAEQVRLHMGMGLERCRKMLNEMIKLGILGVKRVIHSLFYFVINPDLRLLFEKKPRQDFESVVKDVMNGNELYSML